ncbi:hypothetical protein AB0I50_36025, partial [Streptomyces prunicolor]
RHRRRVSVDLRQPLQAAEPRSRLPVAHDHSAEIPADHPALPYVPAQIFGVLRARPVLEGCYADPDYLVRFVEAAVLPALGLT